MELTNNTGLPAGFLVGSTSDDEQLGMVASKVTYRLDERGGLQPLDADQMWPVYGAPAIVNGATILPELEYRKEGVDIIIFGNAVAPNRRAIPRMSVRVECGAVNYPVEVFGDRQWKKSWGRFSISDPLLFEEMPLMNDRAFGGHAIMAGEEVLHPVNPDGRGFCMSKEEVEWKLLPNLERPDELITSWQKPVTPACMFRPKGPLMDATGPGSMAALAALPDPTALPLALTRRMFSQTVPGLVCPSGKLGRTLRLSGFDAAGDVVFPLPPERAVPSKSGPTVHVSVGALRSRFPLSISTIVALVPQRVLVVTWLGLFRYFFRPEEMRTAELRWSGDKTVPPPAAETNRREAASLFTQ
jgi:hypothetical protein